MNSHPVKPLCLSMLATLSLGLASCASRSVTPDVEDITVERQAPSDDDCRSLGSLTGTTLTVKGNAEEALEDMKRTAASKGANYLWVKQYSDTGTSVTGEAFTCP